MKHPALFVLLVLSSSATAAAAPKKLWQLDYANGRYALHEHGAPATPQRSYADVVRALDSQLAKGEWLVHPDLAGTMPWDELNDLTERAARKGVRFLTSTDVVGGRIPNVRGRYSRGSKTKLTIVVENTSPYPIKTTTARFAGCGIRADVPLALDLAPGASKTRTVSLDQIVELPASPADCMIGDLWSPSVAIDFRR